MADPPYVYLVLGVRDEVVRTVNLPHEVAAFEQGRVRIEKPFRVVKYVKVDEPVSPHPFLVVGRQGTPDGSGGTTPA